MRVATWNLAWRSPAGAPGRRMQQVIPAQHADIWVFTEAVTGFDSERGQRIDAGADWGYAGQNPARRKVIAWSRHSWSAVEHLPMGAPRGRLVAATTESDSGPVRVVGVCIPWRDAHVSTGRKDRARWEDHLSFLDAMRTLLARQSRPLVVVGDFNQQLPRARQPVQVHDALIRALDGLEIATAGLRPGLLDHVAHSRDLRLAGVTSWPGSDELGRLSDHAGVAVELRSS